MTWPPALPPTLGPDARPAPAGSTSGCSSNRSTLSTIAIYGNQLRRVTLLLGQLRDPSFSVWQGHALHLSVDGCLNDRDNAPAVTNLQRPNRRLTNDCTGPSVQLTNRNRLHL